MCSNRRRPFRFNYRTQQKDLMGGVQHLYDCPKREITFTLTYINVCISTFNFLNLKWQSSWFITNPNQVIQFEIQSNNQDCLWSGKYPQYGHSLIYTSWHVSNRKQSWKVRENYHKWAHLCSIQDENLTPYRFVARSSLVTSTRLIWGPWN